MTKITPAVFFTHRDFTERETERLKFVTERSAVKEEKVKRREDKEAEEVVSEEEQRLRHFHL